MNILIIGSGARECAIASALRRSPQNIRLFCCGNTTNPSLQQITQGYWVGDINQVDAIVTLAKEWQIDLAMIGPEKPLENGLADALWAAAIATIGPKKELAQIETSKLFARELMRKYDIPGLPRYKHFKTHDDAIPAFLNDLGENAYVIKANGLMSGKGVKVAGEHLHSLEEAHLFCKELLAQNQSIVIEEKLIGQEFSLMCFCDGENVIPMPIVQDYKRAYDADKGPNTGGMGSISDTDHSLPFLADSDVKAALEINQAIIAALNKEYQEKYIGILYGSFIATRTGISVIEFNARFGDPEALNVLSILETDFVAILQAMIAGKLSTNLIRFSSVATVCKYAVPEGYPDHPKTNVPIDISAVKNKSCLFLAAVNYVDNKILATGSRAAAYVGIAECIPIAAEIAEREICAVEGPLFHRVDIGSETLIQERIDAMQKLRA